jgi:hypothetical protein
VCFFNLLFKVVFYLFFCFFVFCVPFSHSLIYYSISIYSVNDFSNMFRLNTMTFYLQSLWKNIIIFGHQESLIWNLVWRHLKYTAVTSLDADIRKWKTAIYLRIGRRFEDWTSIWDWSSIWVLHIYRWHILILW